MPINNRKRRQRAKANNINFKKTIIILLSMTAFLTIMVLVLRPKQKTDNNETQQNINEIFEELNKVSQETIKPTDTIIDITIVGGIACQKEIYEDACDKETKKYNFYNNFYKIVDKISESDLTIGVLDTNFANEEYSWRKKHNAPKELAETLKLIGIDIINSATNYSYDYGIEGIINTKDVLEQNEIDVVGIYRSQEEANNIFIKEVEGIKIAFLSYTYGTNKTLDSEYQFCINIINKEKIKQDIEKAKESNADFILVNMHWGDVNSTVPNENQKELANYIFENGADFIIGTHPTQIQPMEMRKNKEGDDVFLAYSIGNLLSVEEKELPNTGLIINIELRKSAETNEKYLSKVIYTPVYIQDNGKNAINRYEILDIREEIKKYEENSQEAVNKEVYEKLKNVLKNIEGQLINK